MIYIYTNIFKLCYQHVLVNTNVFDALNTNLISRELL